MSVRAPKRILSDKKSSRTNREGLTRRPSAKTFLEAELHSIVENDEIISTTDIVREVVADLVDTAMERIYAGYLEKQTVKFVVHCAHQAYMRLLSLHIYQHSDYRRPKHTWGPDTSCAPSPPDSWAVHQVPVCQTLPMDPGLSTMSKIELKIAEKDYGVPAQPQSTPAIERTPSVSSVSPSATDDIAHIVEDIVGQVPDLASTSDQMLAKKASPFTCVALGSHNYRDYRMTVQLSKISFTLPKIRLPKIALPEPADSKRKAEQHCSELIERLPPIRTDARYKCRLDTPPEDKMKKKK